MKTTTASSGLTETSTRPQSVARSRTKRPGLVNWIVVLATLVPGVLVGGSVWGLKWTISTLDPILSGVAILAGFLFAVLIFVFQLRLQVHYDPRVQQRRHVPDLINELFQLTFWTTIYAVVLTCVMAAVSGAYGEDPLPAVWTIILAAASGVFVSLLIQVCVRTKYAYDVSSEGNELK